MVQSFRYHKHSGDCLIFFVTVCQKKREIRGNMAVKLFVLLSEIHSSEQTLASHQLALVANHICSKIHIFIL